MNEITTVLHEHAEGDEHIEDLLVAVRAGARRRRHRRVVVACGAAVLSVAALIGTTTALGSRGGTPPATQPSAALPRPPAIDRPTAPERPEVIGSDPTLFHLDVVDLPGWEILTWTGTGSGYETLFATSPQLGGEVTVEVSRDPERLTQRGGVTGSTMVWGHSAETTDLGSRHMVRWQPVPGLWAQVRAGGADGVAALTVAESVRLDRVFRCAVPFRLVGLDGMRLTRCDTYFHVLPDGTTPPWGQAWLRVADDTEAEYQVASARTVPAGSTAPSPRVTGVAVPQASPSPAQQGWELPVGDSTTVYFWGFGAADDAVLRALIQAVRPIEDPDVATWPTGPFG
jgi:hypothetical protein